MLPSGVRLDCDREANHNLNRINLFGAYAVMFKKNFSAHLVNSLGTELA
ncbi:hypothetical protein NTGBS_860013 [Candidatus Nitrotoga sp. BS]|nr:hypothetical protein NTGBS_860013 [Candidatus Nitrotoga sp. BS]